MKRRNLNISAIAEEVMGIIEDLCNLAEYGIHSGISDGRREKCRLISS